MPEESKLLLPNCFSTASQTIVARNMAARQNETSDWGFSYGKQITCYAEDTTSIFLKSLLFIVEKEFEVYWFGKCTLYSSWDNALCSDKKSMEKEVIFSSKRRVHWHLHLQNKILLVTIIHLFFDLIILHTVPVGKLPEFLKLFFNKEDG